MKITGFIALLITFVFHISPSLATANLPLSWSKLCNKESKDPACVYMFEDMNVNTGNFLTAFVIHFNGGPRKRYAYVVLPRSYSKSRSIALYADKQKFFFRELQPIMREPLLTCGRYYCYSKIPFNLLLVEKFTKSSALKIVVERKNGSVKTFRILLKEFETNRKYGAATLMQYARKSDDLIRGFRAISKNKPAFKGGLAGAGALRYFLTDVIQLDFNMGEYMGGIH